MRSGIRDEPASEGIVFRILPAGRLRWLSSHPAIAVLDVGFVKPPDLPARRVIACRDVTGRRVVPFRYGDPRSFAEHGTRTMLLAAGDGHGSGLVSPSPRKHPADCLLYTSDAA